jgi:acetyltransferase-like isoleucine patch superfamily enzyme
VGAGAVVVDDVPDAVVAYGAPARVVRSRDPDEPYLSGS